MKRIMNKISILAMLALVLSCADDSLDPFRLAELKKGSLLALRGNDGSSGSLDPEQNFFFKDNPQTGDTFSYVADFISEDQSLLQSIEVYARVGATGARQLVKTVDASGWTIPTGGNSRQGTVSVTLQEIRNISTLGIGTDPALAALAETALVIESDIILTDGSVVPAAAIVNSGLFAAAAFFPAHSLIYFAKVTADFVPVATTRLAGEFVVSSSGTVTRPVFPLKAGQKDTVYISFDQDLLNVPDIAYNNAAITGAGLVAVQVENEDGDLEDSKTDFYDVITAGAGFTGAVTATVSGGEADTFGPILEMDDTKQTINVDNTAPQIVSTVTGTRVGRGQLTTITITFNEAMSAKSANVIKITIDDPNDKIKDKDITDSAFPATMTLASNGLSASYVFLVEELAPNTAVHGPLALTYTGGADLAGNTIAIPAGSLTLDVGIPPSPTMTLSASHDLGTQIKWFGLQETTTTKPQAGANNPSGAIAGTIYYVAVDAGSAAPTKVEFDQDDNAIWTMATDVSQKASGKLTTNSSGEAGTVSAPVFNSFTANGTFDIYAVFKGSTGNVSAIGAPVLTGVAMN
ncbi:MAG: Ig-like domain-containing protein [Cyclobacteriaceae bacterium]